ncbi:MAG: hypothetical protein ACRC78_03080, partial [Planktothrix sp.]
MGFDSLIRKRRDPPPLDPNSVPGTFAGYDNETGLFFADHPIYGRIKGELIGGNVPIGAEIQIINTVPGEFKLITPISPAPVEEKTKKAYYQIAYFYRVTIRIGADLVLNIPFEAWEQREKFIENGVFPTDQTFFHESSFGKLWCRQLNQDFSLQLRYAFDPIVPDGTPIDVQGILEVWSSSEDAVIERGIPYVEYEPIGLFTLFLGNPSTRRFTGTIQPNGRFKGEVASFPSFPSSSPLENGIRVCDDICLSYSDRPPGADINVTSGFYVYEDACQIFLLPNQPCPFPVVESEVAYFFRFEIKVDNVVILDTTYEAYPDREQFLIDGVFPTSQSLTSSSQYGVLRCQQSGQNFSIQQRYGFFLDSNVPDGTSFSLDGFLEIWSSQDNTVIQQGIPYIEYAPSGEFTLFFGNPSSRSPTFTLQPNGRYKAELSNFPTVPNTAQTGQFYRFCEDICISLGSIPDSADIVLDGLSAYTNGLACQNFLLPNQPCPFP